MGKIKIADPVLKDRKPTPATSPVHFALLKRQQTGVGDGWLVGSAAITGIDAAAAMSPILAVQFYRRVCDKLCQPDIGRTSKFAAQIAEIVDLDDCTITG
ncbi:hypothetical protein [Sphingomonas sp.]|uniref:hypothetical protein n=1 Tax=Sphingomonas sp. TaxID=28214 RepID=UPI003B0049B8